MNVPDSHAVAAEIDAAIRALDTLKVPSIRPVRRRYSKEFASANGAEVLAIARDLHHGFGHTWVALELIRYHNGAMSLISEAELDEFGHGMASWGDVDAFAVLLAGAAWLRGQVDDAVIHRWAASPDRWWRRAALAATVTLNTPNQGGRGDVPRALAVCRLLADDHDDMVVKALSWALRKCVAHDADAVRRFLAEHDAELAARVKREVGNKLRTGLKNPKREKMIIKNGIKNESCYDVAIHTKQIENDTRGKREVGNKLRTGLKNPIKEKILITDDISIEKLPRDEANKIIEACSPKCLNSLPTRIICQLYSFVRKFDDPPDNGNWDHDQKLQLCITFSRLVRPTNISFQYAARVWKNSNGEIETIIPTSIQGLGRTAFVVDVKNNFLSESDGNQLRTLIETYNKAPLVDPIAKAMWYHEYAARTYEIDVRCPLIATGIESLINTGKVSSTKQFIQRIQNLALESHIKLSEEEANGMYDLRSRYVHGDTIENLHDEKQRGLYEKMEDILRKTIKKAITNKEFRSFLSDKKRVNKEWPIN